MTDSNRFDILSDSIDENNTSEIIKKPVIEVLQIDSIINPENITETLNIIETKEEIESNVDEFFSVLLNLPAKLKSSFWKDDCDFNLSFKSLTEFSQKFKTLLCNHGDYQLDTLFAAMDYNQGSNLAPARSTLFEFFLYSISKINIFLRKYDYETLDLITNAQKDKIRFSAVIGGRDVGNDPISGFRDSGLELTVDTAKILVLYGPILNYLQRHNKLNIDYCQFNGDLARGIRPVEAHSLKFFTDNKKWTDRFGSCYYNVYRKPGKYTSKKGEISRYNNAERIDTRNYNKFLAVLSFIKGVMNSRSIKD